MKKNKTIKIIISILVLLGAIIVGGLIYVDGLMNNINHTDFSNEVIYEDEDLEIQQEKIIDENLFNSIKFVKEEDIQYSDVEEVSFDKDIINILMLGVEAQGGGNGRTDTIMIGTIDTKNKELKITSIMRDIYVKIPGHSNNKINAAYSYGGVELTKETIKENFGIEVDGTIVVNFESFEKIIDILGGIDVELTLNEANYLNDSNFVKEHTLKEGINHLTGNQALGYARIRYVKEIDGELNDFGRTARQRRILKTLFNTYKNQNIKDLLGTTEEILGLISTDISNEDIIKYATFALTSNIDELETLRLPLDNEYSGSTINGMQVLIPNWDVTIDSLNEFIFNKDIEEGTENVEDNSEIISNIEEETSF